ncbi:hypothetical protein FK531_18925 [Rhodococcus spelaei]|uniref:Transmembrane protein n=1 Tax=Rhodococcus spelaei TaxID=2546320 RepID=A0A541B0Y2_9NOCA|nr:hypothetical protein [Rhodococcus spelaei]TQF65958.1 hypothetical protein FK531_18925 [Rhodococcus spelaei]
MSENGPFGFDPEDLDRVAREVGDGLRDALGKVGGFLGEAGLGTVWTSGMGEATTHRVWPAARPATTGDTGDGVWAIYLVDDQGAARVEQVYASELDALRANKTNTDPRRLVRFLPYGVTVGVLDENPDQGPAEPDTPDTDA